MKNETITKDILFIFARLRNHELSPVVLSVIAAEMYFRGPFHRLIEYCYWMVLWCFGAKRVETLSVGIAQMQLRSWKELGYIDSYSPNISHIMSILSIENNYVACGSYLARFPSIETATPQELSKLYAGRARIFHAKVIESAFNIAKKISLTCLHADSQSTVNLPHFSGHQNLTKTGGENAKNSIIDKKYQLKHKK